MIHMIDLNKENFNTMNFYAGIDKKGEKDQTQSLCFVYIDQDLGLIGGAKLTPLSETGLKSSELMGMGVVNNATTWACSHIFFEVDAFDERNLGSQEVQEKITDFYESLYEGLKNCAHKNGIRRLVTLSTPLGHDELKYQGRWNFSSEGERGDMVMGLLDFSQEAYVAFSDGHSLRGKGL